MMEKKNHMFRSLLALWIGLGVCQLDAHICRCVHDVCICKVSSGNYNNAGRNFSHSSIRLSPCNEAMYSVAMPRVYLLVKKNKKRREMLLDGCIF